MSLEDRKHQRTAVNTDGSQSHFHIEVYDRRYVLDRIHDVSVSGTGIQLPTEIDPGTPIKLVYKNNDYTICVNGTTVWCNSIPLGLESVPANASYRTGIQFDPKDRNCAMFFMALRDYISTTNT